MPEDQAYVRSQYEVFFDDLEEWIVAVVRDQSNTRDGSDYLRKNKLRDVIINGIIDRKYGIT